MANKTPLAIAAIQLIASENVITAIYNHAYKASFNQNKELIEAITFQVTYSQGMFIPCDDSALFCKEGDWIIKYDDNTFHIATKEQFERIKIYKNLPELTSTEQRTT